MFFLLKKSGDSASSGSTNIDLNSDDHTAPTDLPSAKVTSEVIHIWKAVQENEILTHHRKNYIEKRAYSMSRRLLTAQKLIVYTLLVLFASVVPSHVYAQAESCKTVVHILNSGLSPKIDEQELINVLQTLNRTGNRHLPDEFITKKQARERGWRPGRDLWFIENLRGYSLGGDRFMNREHRLPENSWREADLGYKGGHRGSKRLIFSPDGQRFVTVDHYRTFSEVPQCNDR